MLALRPNCECCDKDLPPDSTEAMICSYECTFCRDCVNTILLNVCPNCGGGFAARPIRPKHNHQNNNFLGKHPASTERVNQLIDPVKHAEFAKTLKDIKPQER